MKSIDTIKLLQECDAGTKMAVASIDNMLDKVSRKSAVEKCTRRKQIAS